MKLTLFAVFIAFGLLTEPAEGVHVLEKLTLTSCSSTPPSQASYYPCKYTYEGTEASGAYKDWRIKQTYEDKWIQYQFGKVVRVQKIRILSPCYLAAQPRRMTISFDHGPEQELAPLLCEGHLTSWTICDGVTWQDFNLERVVDTRLVKISITEMCKIDTYASLREVELWGDPEPEEMEQITPRACSSTKPYSSYYDCQYTYEGSAKTGQKHEWLVEGGGTGIWIEYNFRRTVIVKQIRFLQRCHKDDQIKQLKVSVKGGIVQMVDGFTCGTGTKNCDCDDVTWEIHDIQPVVTRSIKLEATGVCGTLNNGLREVEFWGDAGCEDYKTDPAVP